MVKKWIWIVIVLVIALGVGLWWNRPASPPTVRTVVLTATRVEQTVTCNGVVEAVDGVGVFLPISCRVREVRVKVGQRVQKGDVLAVIDKEATLADAVDVATQLALAALEETIVAPEDGIVAEVGAETGKILKVGTPCISLVRSSDLRVRIAIREKDLRVLREGMSVTISGDGLDKKQYTGVLSDISSTASSSSSGVVVAGQVTPNEGEADTSYRLGLTAKVAVITDVTEMGYLVSYEAVLADEKGSYFYVVQDGVARLRRIVDAVQLPAGWLLTDETLSDVAVVLEPEKVGGDGVTVLEATS